MTRSSEHHPSAYATYFNESVHNLRPTANEHQEKPPRYSSIYREKIQQFYIHQQGQKQSFGLAKLPAPDPIIYLKKHTQKKPVRLPDRCQTIHEKKCYTKLLDNTPLVVQARATIPLRYPYHIGDNWVRQNRKEVEKSTPKAWAIQLADGRTGHKELLLHSGKVPLYCLRKTFGHIPQYVKKYQRLSHDRHQHSIAEKKAAQVEVDAQYVWVTLEQRQQVIDNLQQSHGLVMKKFLGQSFALDNQTKIRDQMLLEKELVELEKQLDIIKRHKIIMIKKD